MTKKQIINLFKKHKPKDASAASALGIKLVRIGSGAFREVYVINKTDAPNRLIVKFPWVRSRSSFGSWNENLEHAKHEISMIKKINKTNRFAAMRPFIPKMWYSDVRNGVLMTDFYFRVRETKASIVAQVLDRVTEAIFDKVDERDIQPYNIMQTVDGCFKLVDLGLL